MVWHLVPSLDPELQVTVGRPSRPSRLRRCRGNTAAGCLRALPSAEDERLPDPSTGRALLELALMIGLLVVMLILGLIAVIAGAVNL